MADDEASAKIPAATLTKSSISRNYQIVTECHIPQTNLVDELHNHSFRTVGNNSPSRLPSLPAKSHAQSLRSESMRFPKSRTKLKGALTHSSSFKVERQTTSVASKVRLPGLDLPVNVPEQKRHSAEQRRQIYALNQLMRQLEQQRFREYFKLDESNDTVPAEMVVNIEDSTPKPSNCSSFDVLSSEQCLNRLFTDYFHKKGEFFN